MNILDKLKSIDQSQITDESIKNNINTALQYYDDRENLTAQETTIYERLATKAENHIKSLKDAEKKRIENEKAEQENQQKQIKMQEEEVARKKQGDEINSISWPHQEFAKANNLTGKETTKLKNSTIGFNSILGKYRNSPTNEKYKESAENASNNIVSEMKNYLTEKQNQMTAEETKKAEAQAKAEKEKQDADVTAQAQAKAEADKKEQEAKEKYERENNGVIDSILGW